MMERRGSLVGAKHWLISGGAGLADVLTLDLDGVGRTLPVFSFREEAELFLALSGLDDGWLASENGVGDLVALFLGDGADVESVILDPLPAMLSDSSAGLVALSLGRFVDRFLSTEEPDVVADPS